MMYITTDGIIAASSPSGLTPQVGVATFGLDNYKRNPFSEKPYED